MLREWAPLNDLFNSLPAKLKKGLFYFDVKLTCVDVLPDFIALGTNLGVFYWYDRKRKQIKKFTCEDSNIPVICIKVLSTVDYMVACGTTTGNVSIFQIPKSHPESLPENLKPKSRQIEKYNVTELHKTPVTALAWSKNGMKLFSGDKNGTVVMTEIDFYMHISKSVEILNEAYEVVQLSYANRFLLISTVYRSIICQQVDKWNLNQVGKKDRKVLGRFGGFIVQKSYQRSDIQLYCSRPGLRIWIADVEGNVQSTLLFKDLLTKDPLEVPILNPIPKTLHSMRAENEPSFGVILPFYNDYLVTYNTETVYVLDPLKMSIVTTVGQIRGVLDVATCQGEIFVLETGRSLIRIAYNPEPESDDNYDASFNTYVPLSTSIKGLTEKLQLSTINPTFSTENSFSNNINIYTDDTSVTYAEEATASPLKVSKCFDNIGKQQFNDDILFKSFKKRRKRSGMTSSVTSLSSNGSEEHNPPLVNNILPDMRSPDSITNDIQSKEKMLADMLRLTEIHIRSEEEVFNKENKATNNKDREIAKTEGLNKEYEVAKKELFTAESKIAKNSVVSQDDDVFHSADEIIKQNIEVKGKKKKTEIRNEPNFKLNGTHSSTTTKKEISKFELKKPNLGPSGIVGNKNDASSDTSPGCAKVPFQWNITNINAKDRKDSNKSDISLSDWEIV